MTPRDPRHTHRIDQCAAVWRDAGHMVGAFRAGLCDAGMETDEATDLAAAAAPAMFDLILGINVATDDHGPDEWEAV